MRLHRQFTHHRHKSTHHRHLRRGDVLRDALTGGRIEKAAGEVHQHDVDHLAERERSAHKIKVVVQHKVHKLVEEWLGYGDGKQVRRGSGATNTYDVPASTPHL